MFWLLSKPRHFPHKIHCIRLSTLTYVLHMVNQKKFMYIIIGTMVRLKSGHLISVDGRLLPSVVWINDHIISHIGGGGAISL